MNNKHFKNIYYTGYVTKEDEYRINSVNPLYLIVREIEGFIEEKKGNKCFNIAFTDSNSEVIKKYAEIWSGMKGQIEKINGIKSGKYGKSNMKIKFSSDDYLPLNKKSKFFNLTIIARTVFEEDDKYYPQIFLNDCFYEL